MTAEVHRERLGVLPDARGLYVRLTAREKRIIRKLADEEFGEPKFRWDTFLATLMGGGGLGGFILLLFKGMTAFGAAPANVITSLSGRMTIRRLRAAVGLRQRFASEFDLVTKALHPHTLLLVVDDLDRCKPESVLDILETVNFLASSGDCYIVLGMDPAWVVSCVGERFKDVAAQIIEEREAELYEADHHKDVDNRSGSPDSLIDASELSDDGTRRVTVFARRYLEKLVNVEVPVPVPESGQTRKLLTQGKQDLEDRGLAALLQKGLQFVVRRFGTLVLIAFILVITIFGLFQLPPDPEIEDSEDFADALKIWHPWVIIKRQTPRSIKRYKNRVRYFAMRLRSDDEPQPAWRRLMQRLKGSSADKNAEEESSADETPLQEPLLVALGAIHHCNNHWIEDDDLFRLVKEMKINELYDESADDGMHKPSQEEIQELADAIRYHASSFPGLWPPNDAQRRKFIKLSKGIRTF